MLRTLYYVGALVRGAGRFIDTVGLYTQNNTGRVEKRNELFFFLTFGINC